MAQDLRDLFKGQDQNSDIKLSNDHQLRFEERLEKALPLDERPVVSIEKKTDRTLWMKIAAVLIIALGVLWFVKDDKDGNNKDGLTGTDAISTSKEVIEDRPVLLSDISPDFKKVEDYYMGNIKLELARLDSTDDNKELIDSFMKQLAKLDAEYELLNSEIIEGGVSEETVMAMIDNLKLRLELLFKLKSKLKELKAAPQSGTV